MIIKLTLPTPPSINNYWGHNRLGHTYLKPKAKQFRLDVYEILKKEGLLDLKLEDRLIYNCDYYPPDKRIRDLDNIHKSIFDGLTHAGLYLDDSQIDEMHCYRKPIIRFGKVDIEIIVIK